MQCDEAVNLIVARIDGEIAPDGNGPLDTHLAQCADCRAAAEAMSLQDAQLVRTFAPRRAAAATLVGRVTAEVGLSRQPRRQWWVPLAAAAAGFALAVVLLRSWDRPAVPPILAAATPIAQLDIATGPVECRGPQDTGWQRMATGAAVSAGSRVRTGAGVRCEFAMADGSEVRLNENTELDLAQPRNVALTNGQVFSNVAKGQTPFKLAVGSATITAFGTRFDVQCHPDRVVLAVLQGSTQFSDGAAAGQVVNQGQVVSLANGRVTAIEASTALDQASRWVTDILVLKGHDNPELNERVNDLFAQIGEGKMAFLREHELKALGDGCVIPLTKYLESPRSAGQTFKRQEAARVLADVAQPWCIPYLIDLLNDADGKVRAAAAGALQRLTNENQGRDQRQWRDQPREAGSETLKAWRAWWQRNKGRYPGTLQSPGEASATAAAVVRFNTGGMWWQSKICLAGRNPCGKIRLTS